MLPMQRPETWQDLSPLGKDVVIEMNKQGIMVDISHVTDSTFWQVLRITKAPVIGSHSSCRALPQVLSEIWLMI